MFHKLIYLLGIQYYNPRIWSYYHYLKQSESWSRDQLISNQIEKCRDFLVWAYEKTPYYRELFDNSGFEPDKFKYIDDIKKIPITTKKDLLNKNDQIQIKSGMGKLFKTETSGTTGQILRFYRDRDWDAIHRATIFRGYSWFRVKPWYRHPFVGGFNIPPRKRKLYSVLDWLQNRYRIYDFSQSEVKKFINGLNNSRYIEGYSAMVYELARVINQRNLKFDISFIKGTSDKIMDYYQDEIIEAFGSSCINEYGAAETGIIAFECPERNMHITMENVIVEQVDRKIIVTNFYSRSFPVIRYDLGDYIELASRDYKCSCGREHYILNEIGGRHFDLLYGKKEYYNAYLLYDILKTLNKKFRKNFRYQLVQNRKGEIEFNFENDLTPRISSFLKQEFSSYFEEDLDLILNDKVIFDRSSGKFNEFIGIRKEEKL